MENKYNGWKNYQTWVTALWMENEIGTYNFFHEMSNSCEDKFELADMIKEYFENEYEECVPYNCGWFCDIARRSFEEIDFVEIAEHWI